MERKFIGEKERRYNILSISLILSFHCSFLLIASTDELGLPLTREQRIFLLQSFLHGSYESVLFSLQFIREHFVSLSQRITLPSMMDLFVGMREFVSTQKVTDLLKEIRQLNATEMNDQMASRIESEEVFGASKRITSRFLQGQFDLWLEEKEMNNN